MKKVLFLMAALLTVPLGVNAQDDMYFSSSKQSKKGKNKSAYQAPSASKATDGAKYRTYDDDDVIYNGNGIEDGKETLPNDTLYIDPNETFSDGDGEFVGGFHGSVDDYLHTKRVISWANMSTAIPVGSSLYWNLVYGPNAFDWNVYRVGGIAYVTPTWCNPLYSSFRYNVTWGMTNWFNPWRHNWAGWGWGGFYDPWDPWYRPWDPFYYPTHAWGIGWHGYYGGGGFVIWGGGYSHWPIYGRPSVSRDHARARLSGSDNIRLGETNRSTLRSRSEQRNRISDNRQQRENRAGGHSVRQSQDTRSDGSVRSAARNTGRELNPNQSRTSGTSRTTDTQSRSSSVQSRTSRSADGTYRSTDVQDRPTRTQNTRTNSTYTRSADGRNRSTYTRPSSTRSSEVNRSNSSVSTQQRSIPSRSSTVRSMSESNRSSGSSNRSISTPSTRSNSISSFGTGRSGSSFSGGGGFSGGGRSGGGFSGGGSRGGGGGGRR